MKFWTMKTLKAWSEVFKSEGYVGIDQPAIDDDYRKLSGTPGIDAGLNTGKFTRAIMRNFDQFVYDMKEGDMIVVGVGSTTNFNVSFICRVTEDYKFYSTDLSKFDFEYPRHARKIKITHKFETPVPYEAFNRVARLEFLSEGDWDRMMSKVFK